MEQKNIDFDSQREALRQALADHEELQMQERERRQELDRQLQALDSKKALLTESWEKNNSEFLEVVNSAKQHADDIEARLRKHILEAYEAKPADDPKRKQIATGLSVRVDKKYLYEESDAISFALDRKMPEILNIDGPKFKKLMAIQPQPFVTVKEVPTPVISFKK